MSTRQRQLKSRFPTPTPSITPAFDSTATAVPPQASKTRLLLRRLVGGEWISLRRAYERWKQLPGAAVESYDKYRLAARRGRLAFGGVAIAATKRGISWMIPLAAYEAAEKAWLARLRQQA